MHDLNLWMVLRPKIVSCMWASGSRIKSFRSASPKTKIPVMTKNCSLFFAEKQKWITMRGVDVWVRRLEFGEHVNVRKFVEAQDKTQKGGELVRIHKPLRKSVKSAWSELDLNVQVFTQKVWMKNYHRKSVNVDLSGGDLLTNSPFMILSHFHHSRDNFKMWCFLEQWVHEIVCIHSLTKQESRSQVQCPGVHCFFLLLLWLFLLERDVWWSFCLLFLAHSCAPWTSVCTGVWRGVWCRFLTQIREGIYPSGSRID